MNERRRTLRQEHAGLRKLLSRNLKGQKPADITEQVNALRQTWRDALPDQIRVSDALNRELFFNQFLKLFERFPCAISSFRDA
jgi:hypothetical protein